jgi:glycosyltransferase involved in cell wall biosynthesis
MPPTNQPSNPPLVSVIIGAYNAEKYLAQAIESILAQTFTDYEIILIDDGSTDRTKEIAQSYPEIRYFYQENQGVAAARNRGVAESLGEYLTFLDADDLWLPDKLALQIEIFAQKAQVDIVTGYIKQFVSPDIDPIEARKYAVPTTPQVGYSLVASMLTREVLRITGDFHQNLSIGETISWFALALEKNLRIEILPQIVAKRRIHGQNMSILSQQSKGKTIARILKASLDRRRSQSTSEEQE